ncbi:acyl-CoA carboxylase epsilon subunit [Streptomyces fagopyri]|uniref:acyl-CoA carboxylase epsilon subunit n=1 Tax=Streptomyces fagopyri TaxID=2662397 RepID=UPI003815C6CD
MVNPSQEPDGGALGIAPQGDDRPLVRVVRGNATDEDLAAIVSAFAAAGATVAVATERHH